MALTECVGEGKQKDASLTLYLFNAHNEPRLSIAKPPPALPLSNLKYEHALRPRPQAQYGRPATYGRSVQCADDSQQAVSICDDCACAAGVSLSRPTDRNQAHRVQHLPLTTTTQVCKIDLTMDEHCRCDCDYLFLTTTKLQYALLATSKLIRDEASSYLDWALAKTQPVLFHCSGLNDGSEHVHTYSLWQVLCNAVASERAQGYRLGGLAEGGIFANDDLAKVLDFCGFAKQHHNSTGRNPKAEVHWPKFPLHTLDDLCEVISDESGLTVFWLKKPPAALRLRLAEYKEV